MCRIENFGDETSGVVTQWYAAWESRIWLYSDLTTTGNKYYFCPEKNSGEYMVFCAYSCKTSSNIINFCAHNTWINITVTPSSRNKWVWIECGNLFFKINISKIMLLFFFFWLQSYSIDKKLNQMVHQVRGGEERPAKVDIYFSTSSN